MTYTYAVYKSHLDIFNTSLQFFYPHPKTGPLTLERGEGREREGGEKQLYDTETSVGCLSYSPPMGTKPACALSRNWTCDLSVYRMMFQLTKPH